VPFDEQFEEIIIHGGPNNEPIARMDLDGCMEGDPELIRHAVNSHDALVMVLEAAEQKMTWVQEHITSLLQKASIDTASRQTIQAYLGQLIDQARDAAVALKAAKEKV
jgi:hypothetical protein